MFPDPQDALPLPPRPNLEQYKKRAKELLKAAQSPGPAALRTWTANWIDSLVRLSDLILTPQLPVRTDHWTDQLETFAREKLSESSTLTSAQFVIARAQGFESWPKLAKHLEEMTSGNSPANNFELAADAIITGDVATLEKLLRERLELIRTRSPRRHQATLLHYISANGVEGYRQKTPRNIVPIAKLLLDAGADVHAIADVYGGSTTFALVATSAHPERAGVQESMMQLLLDHGATIDAANSRGGALVTSCLANGHGKAAEFLAQRGAALDLEGAAGLGRLETVKNFFDADPQRNLKDQTIERALLWACEYGRNDVVDFLLQYGVSPQAQANTGQTALHCAVIGGHTDTIRLLLTHGAQLEAKNAYGGTALGQAIWSALNGDQRADHVAVIEALLNAGSKIEGGILAWVGRESAPALLKENIVRVLKRHGANS